MRTPRPARFTFGKEAFPILPRKSGSCAEAYINTASLAGGRVVKILPVSPPKGRSRRSAGRVPPPQGGIGPFPDGNLIASLNLLDVLDVIWELNALIGAGDGCGIERVRFGSARVSPARFMECRFNRVHLRALESCGTFEPARLKSSRNDYAQRSGPAVSAIRRRSTPWSFCI